MTAAREYHPGHADTCPGHQCNGEGCKTHVCDPDERYCDDCSFDDDRRLTSTEIEERKAEEKLDAIKNGDYDDRDYLLDD